MTGRKEQTTAEGARQVAAARVGSTVRSKWRLDKLIGYGGMAAVYAATHESGRVAALKIMHAELCRDDEIRERFLREGDIARKVEHPGVVRIFDDDVTEHGEPFLVMELLQGTTLSRLWRKHDKKLPLEASLTIAVHVLDALATFHSQKIVHRDLKPANIFITREREVKVLDFGVAQMREAGRDMTRAGLAMGTPSYMAPEQALGKSEQVDHRADIYAVGATLYTLISGRKLHQGATEQESHVLAATQPAPSVARVAPELPLAVVTIIDRALQWDQRNRYQSVDKMRAAIEAYLDGEEQPTSERSEPVAEESIELELDDASNGSLGSLGSSVASGGSTGAFDDSESVSGSGVASLDIELAFEPPRHRAPAGIAPSHTLAAPREAPRPAGHAPLAPHRPARGAMSDDVPLPHDHWLAPMFVALDRLLRTARQYGPSHPETQNRMAPVFEATSDALERQPAGIQLKVLPFCFTHGADTVWEPSPPGDIVPYTLSVAGLRELHIVEGVGEEELRELLAAMMMDAGTNPTEIATALWEAPFQHIHCRIEEELGGEDAQSLEDFFAEATELEKELQVQLSDVQKMALSMQREDVMEAAAVAAMKGKGGRSGVALLLDDEAHERLSQATKLRASELRLRHDLLLIDAFEDATRRRDVAALSDAVSSFARRLVRIGRDEELFNTHGELARRLADPNQRPASQLTPAMVTATLFPGDVLMHVVRTASGWSDLLAEEQTTRALEAFAAITRAMGPRSMPAFLELANRLGEGPVLELIVAYVGRVAHGNEQDVLSKLETMNPLTAQRILGVLIERGGDRVKALLRPLMTSANSALRCEAIALTSASHLALTQELMRLFKSDDRDVRWAALDTFVRHRVLSAGPALVGLVEESDFAARALDEQQTVFEALSALNPTRSEALMCSVVAKHGLMRNEALERTRMLAARMLGEHAESDEALEAVRAASARRPWNGAPLREAAMLAAQHIGARRALSLEAHP